MKRICPDCERPSFYPRRGHGDIRASIPKGYLSAVTIDGMCTTCWRAAKGIFRESTKSGITFVSSSHRPPMTEADYERVKADLAKLAEARRRRGIPKDGLDPAALARPGRYLIEA